MLRSQMRFFKALVPRLTRDSIQKMPFIGKLSAPLLHPSLWQLRRTPVARGAAVGAFLAFATPVAQIPLSILAALLMRLHIPTAALATLINTPLTFAPVYYAAYRLGDWLLSLGSGQTSSATQEQVSASAALFELGPVLGSTLLGAFLFGVVAAVLAYFGVQVVWAWRARLRARRWARMRRVSST